MMMMMMMSPKTLRVSVPVALALLLACCVAASARAERGTGSVGQAEHFASSEESEIKGKAFKFTQFKALFHKSYKSIAEETRRQTLYLANLFQMFSSYLNYRFKRASSFNAVNQMSDWTREEFQATLMDTETYLEAMRASEYDFGQNDDADDDEQPAAQSSRAPLGELLSEEVKGLTKLELAGGIAPVPNLENNENSGDSCSLEKEKEKKKKTALGERVKRIGEIVGKSLLNGADRGISAVDGLIQDTFHKVYTRKPAYRPDLPDEVFVDHRDSNCLTRAKDQSDCGSCYIFATLALYEWAYCKREGARVQFSEQYLLDCGHKVHMHGCSGGFGSQVSRFISKYGLELSDRYRYHAQERKCPYEAAKVPKQTMGFVRMDRPKLGMLMVNSFEKQLETSPVLVTIYPSSSFSQYGGGIDEGKGCGDHRLNLHAVLLVGHGRKDGHEYWIIRNSYGFWFGDWGYYKVRKDSKCLADFGVGHTLKALMGTSANKKTMESNESNRLKSGSSMERENSESFADEYKFFENPKYDWKILANISEMAPQSPPTLPKNTPV